MGISGGRIMLGYTREQHADMMRGIRDGIFYLPPSAEESANNLRMAFDFINGLFEEGHIQ
jgi:hypothetical protein